MSPVLVTASGYRLVYPMSYPPPHPPVLPPSRRAKLADDRSLATGLPWRSQSGPARRLIFSSVPLEIGIFTTYGLAGFLTGFCLLVRSIPLDKKMDRDHNQFQGWRLHRLIPA